MADKAPPLTDPVSCLKEYVSIKSMHPNADTVATVDFLIRQLVSVRDVCERMIVHRTEDRENLYAVIGGKSNSPVVLLHHMDVVTASDSQFKPFVKDGRLVARGALDDKGLGVIHLYAFLRLAQLVREKKARLARPVCFLAVCDEEIGGKKGANMMAEHLFGAQGYFGNTWNSPPIVFDEGGYWIRDVFRRPICNIAVTEKPQLVLKISFFGKPGHGSVPHLHIEDSARAKADVAGVALFKANQELPLILNPATERTLQTIRELKVGKLPIPITTLARMASKKNSKIHTLTHSTINLTADTSDADINVMPSRVDRYLDIRMLPDTTVQDMLAYIESVLKGVCRLRKGDDYEVEIVRRPTPARYSDMNGVAMRVIEAAVKRYHPNASVTPSMLPGISDSRHFRIRGCQAYGIVPMMLTSDEVDNIHGTNERIPVDELEKGIDIMSEILMQFAV